MAEDGDRLPVVLMAALPILATRLGVEFLRFQSRRKRGVRRFRRTLVRGGMNRKEAATLAQQYHEAGSVRELLRAGLAAAR